jgi:hypothetical protein
MNATAMNVVGVDLAKNVFQAYWVEPGTGEIKNVQIKRAKFLTRLRLRPTSDRLVSATARCLSRRNSTDVATTNYRSSTEERLATPFSGTPALKPTTVSRRTLRSAHR